MVENYKRLVNNVYEQLNRNYSYIWPIKNGWPPENNIALAISVFCEKNGWYLYAECNMNGQMRDLLIVDPKEKWVCQVEIKHIYWNIREKILDDIWRIYWEKNVDDYFEGIGKPELKNYKKFGLFIGGCVSNMYTWWLASIDKSNHSKFYEYCTGEPKERIENMIKVLDNWKKIPASSLGIYPNNPEKSPFWIAYYFTPCGMDGNIQGNVGEI